VKEFLVQPKQDFKNQNDSFQAFTIEYPRSCARLTATIPAGTMRELLNRFAINSLWMPSVVPPAFLAIDPA
jgi:hypothetical protein